MSAACCAAHFPRAGLPEGDSGVDMQRTFAVVLEPEEEGKLPLFDKFRVATLEFPLADFHRQKRFPAAAGASGGGPDRPGRPR